MKRFLTLLGSFGLGFSLLGCEAVNQVANAVGRTKVSMTLKNGEKVEGTLLQDGDGKSLVQVKYGTVTVTTGDVLNIEKQGEAEGAHPGSGRLAKWDQCLHIIASRPWASRLTQVPATVIDKGILKHVPYLSHRSGSYEFNIYGDPDQPACLEIGIYGMTPPESGRKECMETMVALLSDSRDRQALRTARLDKSLAQVDGMSIEVTPPGADDAYGAWWISVYSENDLNQQRASQTELAKITRSLSQIMGPPPAAGSSPVASGVKTPHSVFTWGEQDLKNARPPVKSSPDEVRVYVKGVYRKNGTYAVWKS